MRFSSYRADTICDRQTDRQTDGQTDRQTDARGKTLCLPTLKGGDIDSRKRGPLESLCTISHPRHINMTQGATILASKDSDNS